ncbi:MAG: RNA polymerase sigma factor [Hyphomicrobiaceae bacterium]|nr:MAG: RNA polymerase sigma factor [Hyphomicrobiaceae bacterium]
MDAIAAEIPRLRRYARALVGGEGEADDLVQDCLERAIARIELWRDGDSPRRWLFTILHNIHVDRRRGAARRPEVIELDDAIADPASGTSDSITACEVSAALQKLPEEQREAVLLVGLEGLSYAETAEVLGVPIGTVMSRLSRGRERLRKLLERNGSETPSLRRVK